MPEVRLLGPMEWQMAGQLLDLGPPKQRAVFAALVVDAGQPVRIETLVDRVWDDDPPAQARNALYIHVMRIRRLLSRAAEGGEAGSGEVPRLDRTDGGYLLRIDPRCVDLHRFRLLVDLARQAQLDDERAALLREALALWRGLPLADLSGAWVDGVRDRWRRQRIDAEVTLASVELRLGNPEPVIARARELSAEHPLVEPLAAVLIRALCATGRSAEALEFYDNVRRRLGDELGVDPGPELQQLYQQILRGDAGLMVAPPSPPVATAAQLPVDVPGFAGRTSTLAALDAMLAGAGEQRTAAAICVVSGTAGVGKTALAVHWAHRVRDRFPDGQLYVDLRGFDSHRAPVNAAEAVHGFLEALHVPPQRIPATLQARVGLLRSLLADRRVLVVLDNARDAAQVRPLLPAAPGCLAVVTSRNRLSGVVATEGAQPIRLDLLPAEEAWELLVRRLGRARIAAEPRAVDEIIARCSRLPLALAIVAARAAAHPHFALAALAGELGEAQGGLDGFAGDDPATDVRCVFSWSYETLSDPAARMFRLLGLHPGPDIGIPAAASLIGGTASSARPLLAELARAHLLSETVPGRFTCHDLLRAYATELAQTQEPEQDRHFATQRMLDHYLSTALAADRHLAPQRDPIAAPGIDLDAIMDSLSDTITDHDEALAWFTAERATLLAAIERAANGFAVHAWQLAWATASYLDRQGHWHEWAVAARTAVAAARRLADRYAQAQAHRGLALAYVRLGRHADGRTHYRKALEHFNRLGDHAGQAHTHLSIGMLANQLGRHVEAMHHSRQALHLYQTLEHASGQARALNGLGWLHMLDGEHEQAIECCQRALVLLRDADDRGAEAAIWDSLGYAHHRLGQHQQAIDCFGHALQIFRKLADRLNEADILIHLGEAHQAAGDTALARDAWRHARDILVDVGHEGVGEVQAKLDGLDLPARPLR